MANTSKESYFRLTSSSTNSQDRTAATSAEGDYDAKGFIRNNARNLLLLQENQEHKEVR